MNLPSSSPSPTSSTTAVTDAVMSVLLRLPSAVFTDLIHSLTLELCLRQRRLLSLLRSPPLFSSTLSYLRTLPLPQKTLLVARLLLSSLHHLLPLLTASPRHRLRLRDLDAALLLMAMCDSYENNTTISNWHTTITKDILRRNSSPFCIGDNAWNVVSHYVDSAAKCRRFLEVVQVEEGKVGAAVAAVVALPSVECRSEGRECVICKEEIEVGRDVCELPCRHWFHWRCVLSWLKKRNTCPVCRFELPTDDVLCEMRRVWRAVARVNNGGTIGSHG